MIYSLEPNYNRYVKGYGFLSFARKFGKKCGNMCKIYVKNVNTAKKTGMDRTYHIYSFW